MRLGLIALDEADGNTNMNEWYSSHERVPPLPTIAQYLSKRNISFKTTVPDLHMTRESSSEFNDREPVTFKRDTL